MRDPMFSSALPTLAAAPSGPSPVDVWTAEREFPEAFLVNPYNLDGTAERLGAALTMPEPQRRERMTRLRERVLEWNIYRWAGEMLDTALRLPDPEVVS